MTPQRSIWILTVLMAFGVSAGVYRIPIQVSDSLEVLERVNSTPSLRAVFVDSLSSSRTMLRPLRQVQSKVLLNLASIRGVGHTRAFRGFHAVLTGLLFVLFAAVLRGRTWDDVAAAMFAVTVLTGLHTTAGMLQEAYPVNHFLLIAIYSLVMLLLARGRAGLATDLGAALCLALAVLTLESGILVFPVAIAAYLAGERGISRPAFIAMGLIAGAYVYFRFGYLEIGGTVLGERPIGFGLSELDANAIRDRFPNGRLGLYAYNAISSMLTVLLSQPMYGTWTAVRSWLDSSLRAFDVITVGTSTVTTILILRYVCSRNANGVRRLRETVPLATMTLLAGSAAMSYAYTKSEIMSAAGVFYALVAYHSVRHLLERAATWAPATRQAVILVTMMVSCGWAIRGVGLEYRLERSAFAARNEWVHDESYSLEAHTTTPLESSLRRQALRRAGGNPYLMPQVAEDIWGTE